MMYDHNVQMNDKSYNHKSQQPICSAPKSSITTNISSTTHTTLQYTDTSNKVSFFLNSFNI